MIMMNVASQKIFKLFQDNAHKPFVIVEHNGNFGDHLISNGGYKLADLAGLDYKVVSHDEFMASTYDENTVIYFQGGGGFNPYCDGQVWEQLQKVCATHKGLTIGGPQTYINDSKFLKNTVFKGLEEKGKGRVILFVREKVSHKILKENMPLWM